MKVRRVAYAAIVALTLTMGLVACGDSSEAQPSAPPDCPGSATTDYGLGNAVHDAVAELADLPKRFGTGAAAVLPLPNSDRVAVEVNLCASNAMLDDTKDAASVVAREVASAPMLRSRVARMTVVNPTSSQRITTQPFDAEAFESATAISRLRPRWQPVER